MNAMILRKLLVSAVAAAVPSLALAAAPTPAPKAPAILKGDAAHGEALFRLHCASCHGTSGRGDGFLAKSLASPKPTDLRNPSLMLQRGDAELHDTVLQGGEATGRHFTMPAFENQLGVLDAWDLVAFLRRGQPTVTDYFPDVVRYTTKTYALDAESLGRAEKLLGKLTAEEARVPVVAVFGGPKSKAGPIFVPQTPRDLDTLKPKRKLGYLTFVSMKTPWAAQPVALALAIDREGFIQTIKPDLAAFGKAEQERATKVLASFVGAGGKASDYEMFKAPKVPPKEAAEAAELAKGFTRAYYRALEGALMFDKEERDRHWAD